MNLIRTKAALESCIEPELVLANQRTKSQSEVGLIEMWISAAEEVVERSTNRSIMKQTFKLSLPTILPTVTLYRPGMNNEIDLISAQTVAGDNTTDYGLDDMMSGRFNMLPTVSFPAIRKVAAGVIDVTYSAGASDPKDVPASVRQAVLLLASHWFRNREAVVTDQRRGIGVELPYGFDKLVSGLRIPNVNIAPNEV